jgi:hypothetical protein
MGFRPGYTLHGGPPAIQQCKVTDGTVIYQGDVVKMNNGRVNTVSATSDYIYGVAAAYSESTDENSYVPVYNDLRNTIFIAQCDSSNILGTSLTGPELHYDLTITTGSTVTQLSAHEIDDDASDQDTLYIIDKVNTPDNDWGDNVDVYCRFLTDVTAVTSVETAT